MNGYGYNVPSGPSLERGEKICSPQNGNTVRAASCAALAVILLSAAQASVAQSYPQRPVRIVVLLGAPDRILSRDQLLDMSRLHNDDVHNRSVDAQIMRLRRKIEPVPSLRATSAPSAVWGTCSVSRSKSFTDLV
jgi:hypothetical protein